MSLDHVSEPVRRLATLVSLAARIEPELLRAARLRLLPDVDVSAEADLWFSVLVASRSTRRIVLDAEVAATLQAELKKNPDLLAAARAIVVELHAEAPPAIQLEEEITWLALSGGDVQEAIETKLTAVLNAIATEGRTGLVDWAARALPRMPELARETKAAAALQLVTGGHSAGPAVYVRTFHDPALSTLVARALPALTVYARLVPDGVEIGRAELPFSHPIELPKTEPLVVELAIDDATEVVDIPQEGTLFRPASGDVAIRTVAGDVYQLRDFDEPPDAGTVRLLVLTRLSMRDFRIDVPPPDAVLIAGDVAEEGRSEEYHRIAERLSLFFGRAPVVAVPGPHDVVPMVKNEPAGIAAFDGFRERLGQPRTRTIDSARTLSLGNITVGVAGIHTAYGQDAWLGSFHALQVAQACGGDAASWCRAHDLAILLMHHAPGDLDHESRLRWKAFGAERIFDVIVYGSRADEPHRVEPGALLVGAPQLTNPEQQGYAGIDLRVDSSVFRVTVTRERLHSPEGAVYEFTLGRRERIDLADEKHPRRRVLVAGIAEQLSVALQELCRALGGLLGLQGHELLTGGWPGVDYLVAEGFERAAPERVTKALTHYLPEGKHPDAPFGRYIARGSDEESLAEAVRAADVVILIEGASGTLGVGREALRQGKPLIPIGAGAAADLRREAMHAWPSEVHQRLQHLANRSDVATTVGVVRELVLNAFSPRESTGGAEGRKKVFLSYHRTDEKFVNDFRQVVEAFADVELWHDQRTLGRGDEWLKEIDAAIRSSAAAVVFLSASYLASNVLGQYELRRLIESARERELALTWFLVHPCAWHESEIANIQAAHDPSQSLAELRRPQREEVYARAAEILASRLMSAEDVRDLVHRQMQWGISLEKKLEGPPRENLQRAIDSYRIALQRLRASQRTAEEWHELRRRLMEAFVRLADIHASEGNLYVAMATYEKAAQLFTELGLPDDARELAERAAKLAPRE